MAATTAANATERGISHRQNFNQDIRKHQDFEAALAKLNVAGCSLNKSARLTHFRLL
jgi:hypothetical protein